jgi:hypothetical protein
MDGGDMTLAFDLSALKTLANPGDAVTDARQWTSYVGVVSDAPTYEITNFTRQHRIRQDFFSGPQDRTESLAQIRDQFDTERYVLVAGRDGETADAATHPGNNGSDAPSGWEVLAVADAADAAGWSLGDRFSTDPEDRP